MKTVFVGVRIDPTLKARAEREAASRGMTISEFIRYALLLFFDLGVDSKPQTVDNKPDTA
jgi:hypothetical protein